MKFSDIPKFTKVGNYQVDVSLDYIEACLYSWANERGSAKLDMNPDFQRGHVWTKDQQRAYVEYKLSGGPGADIIYFNCVGWMNTYEGPFVLVDGLQRLTALLAFLDNRLDVFGGYTYCDFEDKFLLKGIGLKFNVNNLKTRKEVLTWYVQMNSGGTPHTKEEIERVKKLMEIE